MLLDDFHRMKPLPIEPREKTASRSLLPQVRRWPDGHHRRDRKLNQLTVMTIATPRMMKVMTDSLHPRPFSRAREKGDS